MKKTGCGIVVIRNRFMMWLYMLIQLLMVHDGNTVFVDGAETFYVKIGFVANDEKTFVQVTSGGIYFPEVEV